MINGELLPLTDAQLNIWFHQLIDPRATGYNIGQSISFRGHLDLKRLAFALKAVIDRFDNLRCRFVVINDEPFQIIDEDVTAPFLTWDVRDQRDPALAAQEIITGEFEQAFDLKLDRLCRFGLIQIADDQWEWFWVMHHLVNDGWGCQVAMQYMAEVYLDSAASTKPIGVSWAQTVRRALEYRGSETYLKDRQYWQSRLEGIEANCSLANRPVAVHAPDIPASYSTQLSREQYDRIVATGHRLGVTPFAVLTAIYAIYLSRLTGKLDICLAIPALGRDTQARLAGGMMSNPVVLRIAIAPQDSFADVVQQTSAAMRGVLRHSRYPITDINKLHIANRELVPFNLEINLLSFNLKLNFGSLAAQLKTLKTGPVGESALRIYDNLDDGPVELRFEYEPDYLSESSVVKHLDRLTELFLNLPDDDTAVASVKIIRDIEFGSVLELFRGKHSAIDQSHSTLPELFEQQVARTPEATALVFDGDSLTYAQLDARANQLARHLISLGIGPEQIVAIALPRSIEMVVALIAVLKSGAAYLPVDPDYPTARLAFMLTDSGASLLISQVGVIQEALDTHRLNASQTSNVTLAVLQLNDAATQVTLATLDQAPITQAERITPLTPQNLAYLIYTSGSTGTPKGAGNTQLALINRLDWMRSELQLTSVDRVLQKTPWSFDVSVWEFLLPVFNGATLIVAKPEGHKDPRYLEQLIREQGVTTLHFVPSMLDAFLASKNNHDALPIKHLVTSGEALSGSLQHECLNKLPNTLLWNFYGPTEAAIDVTYWQCRKSDGLDTPPIGYPIWNTQIYILDASLSPLPVGVAGELYIAGAGLARGYLGRAGLTAERFVANPFTPGARMYRSGDLARWTEDGVLEYLGRADAQVKIRGFRIELGEIEAALVAIPGIAQCTVQARGEDVAKQLVAYLVASSDAVVGTGADVSIPETAVIRSVLSSTLPDYMVPAAFVVLDSLPLTPNGKLDVRALPAPEITGEGEYRAPVTEHEQLVANLFAELTGATRVGLDDSFFALGGHSLLAMRLLSQLRTRTGLELALRILFEQPTVAGVAQALDQVQAEAQALAASGAVAVWRPPIIPGQGVANPEADGTQRVLSYGQIRLWTLEQIEGASGNYNMPAALRLSGALQAQALGLALRDVIERHEPLRTVIANEDGEPRGYVRSLDRHAQILEQEDLSVLNEAERTEVLEQTVARDATKSFDLSRDLMIRARLIKLSGDQHVLTLVMHHIAGDGVSMGVFCKELTQAYGARAQDQAPGWTPLAVSYADHAAWQRAWLEDSGELARQSQSWQAQLAGIPERLSLPTDHPREAGRSRAARYLPIEISAQTTAQLLVLANRHQTTLFTVLIALYGTLLGR
ncbi:amino acid adenylation domain-containing protein, partial [Alcaligenaceae bacterium LF4-65]